MRYIVQKHPDYQAWIVWDTQDNTQVSRSWWERFDAQKHADKCNGLEKCFEQLLQRDELIRIQSETIEHYKQAIADFYQIRNIPPRRWRDLEQQHLVPIVAEMLSAIETTKDTLQETKESGEE